MKTTFKRALSAIIALCVLLASATCLMGVSVFAEEKVNIALIDETSEADKNRVIASAEATGQEGYNLFDGQESVNGVDKWWTGNSDIPAYVIIDLGQDYNLSGGYVMATTNGDRDITYDIYAISGLGELEYKAENKAEISAAIKAGAKLASNQKHAGVRNLGFAGVGRYVMIEVTDCVATGTDVRRDVSVAEFKIYGEAYVPGGDTSSESTSSDTSSESTSSDTSSNNTSSEGSNDSQGAKQMLRMELGKLRGTMNKLEWHVFPFRFAEGNTAIKPNTTYTFSFEYYSFPGTDGKGVNGGTFFARTGKAGNGYNANVNLATAGTFANKGRNTATITFTTKGDANGNVIYMGLETGSYATSYGEVFAWDFSLVENGKTENLIENENFYGKWSDYTFTGINTGSHDGKGAYSFAPFDEEIASLANGATLSSGDGSSGIVDDTSSNNTSSEDNNTNDNNTNDNNTNDDSNSGSDDDSDKGPKRMLKQENYKLREWENEETGDLETIMLKYQNFHFDTHNTITGAIKENTTYIYSVEYYADPGEWETGVNSSAIFARTNTETELGAPPKDFAWNEEFGSYYPHYILPTGRNTIKMEFTTFPGQTTFSVGHLSGHDGNAYFWDFKLYEKGGDGTNLLKNENFYGDWQDYVDAGDFVAFKNLSPESLDGQGTYSFVPFNQNLVNLKPGDIYTGKVELEEGEEGDGSFDDGSSDDGSSDDGSSDDGSSDDGWNDDGYGDEGTEDDGYGDEDSSDDGYGDEGTGDNWENEGDDQEVVDTGDASNAAAAVAVMFFATLALAGTSLKMFRKN